MFAPPAAFCTSDVALLQANCSWPLFFFVKIGSRHAAAGLTFSVCCAVVRSALSFRQPDVASASAVRRVVAS
jgi:hypothetical protein